MADFYIILHEQEKPKFDAHVEGVLLNQFKQVIPIIFNKGKSLKDFLKSQFYIEKEDSYSKMGKYRDRLSTVVNSSNPLFVASAKLESLLNEMGNGQVEFFNLTILDNKGVANSDYKIVNIINKIECINYEESELDFEFYDGDDPSGDIITTYKLAIKTEQIPDGLNIFLLDKYKDEIIVVHERLKSAIIQRGLSGFVFCKVEDFQS